MRPHTTAEALAVIDCVGRWQDVFLAVLGRRWCTPRTSTTCWPSGRSPAAEAYEGFAHARGRHRHGPGVRGGVRRGGRRGRRGAARVLRLGRRGPGRGLPRPPRRRHSPGAAGVRRLRQPWRWRSACASSPRRGPGRDPHRRATVPGCCSPWSSRSGATTSGSSPSRTATSAATSPSPGCMVGEDLARVLGRRARGPPLPAARRLPVRRTVPRRRPHPTTCPGPSRSCATDGVCAAPGPGGPDAWRRAARGRHRRPPQRRQVHAPEPHRRASARRSSRRSPGSPATARRSRPSGAAATFRLVDTGGWMARRLRASTRRCPTRRAGHP